MRKLHLIILQIFLFLNVYATDIPLEHTRIMNAALMKVFNISNPESIERFSNGFSSPGLYKISVSGKDYVVRFSSKNKSLEDRQRELDAMQIVAEQGLAPKIIYANPMEGIIIMDFINASKNSKTFNPLSEVSLKLLGTGMRKIHEGPAFKKTTSVFDTIKHFESTQQGEIPSTIIQAFILLDELHFDLRELLIKKPCHNDLNPNNILFSEGKIYFIDWEFAGQADPFFDLASPVILYAMSEKQEKTVLNAYFEREPYFEEVLKFQKMKKVAMIYYGSALVSISLAQGEDLISEKEIQSLPCVEELLKDGDKLFPKGIQRYGLALMRKALDNSSCLLQTHDTQKQLSKEQIF